MNKTFICKYKSNDFLYNHQIFIIKIIFNQLLNINISFFGYINYILLHILNSNANQSTLYKILNN